MATKFTPTTTISPMAVNDASKLDEAIGLVQGMIQQRRATADQQWQSQERNRVLQARAAEEEQRAIAEAQNQTYRELMTREGTYDQEGVRKLAISGKITNEQAQSLMPLAKDYVSDADRRQAFAEGLAGIDIYDPAQVAELMGRTGIDRTEANFLLSQKEQGLRVAGTGGSGGSGGTGGSGRSRSDEEAITAARANAELLREAFNSARLEPIDFRITNENAQLLNQSYEEVKAAKTKLDNASATLRGNVRNHSRFVGSSAEAAMFIRDIDGFSGYTIKIDDDDDISIIQENPDAPRNRAKEQVLLNQVGGLTYEQAREIAGAREQYNTVIRSVRDRLNRWPSQQALRNAAEGN